MIPLVGYLDRLSARPGERIEVKVSSRLAAPYRADLVRIVHADPNPAGPGMKLLDVPSGFAGSYPSRAQEIRLGSCGVADLAPDLCLPDSFTLCVRVQPWLLDGRTQAVLALQGAAGGTLTLFVAKEGAQVEIGGASCAVAAPMLERSWYELRCIVAPDGIALFQRALAPSWGVEDSGAARVAVATPRFQGGRILFGAAPGDGAGRFRHHLNGRIEDPMLLEGIQDGAALLEPEAAGAPVAWWDFSRAIPTQTIEDRGPRAMHGRLRNLPTRAVRGSRWDGSETCWRHAPRHYAAIHFHEDDLIDCEWQTDFAVEIPDGMRSGVYGVRLRGEGGEEDVIPFYVLPPRGTTQAPIAYLASTFTYQAYFNHARGNSDDAFRARRAAWGAYPHNPDDHPEVAASTYNRHPDGSGVCYSSLRRPLLSMRPGYLTFDDARGSGLRHFPADSHLTDWLEAKGLAFDVITDHDLHREGVDLLRRYRAVVTGSHPEYHTPQMLDALQDYVGDGGRLVYMGGNGFYWRIAVSDAVPDVLEVRRAEGGIRAWAAEPGEYFHALDGGYGGLWRRNGRPPQRLAGIGFSGQGQFEGSYYRRLPDSHAPDMGWIFAGIDGEILGDFGLSGGGAAGFELDRADRVLGSPPNIRILARSERHQSHFVTVPEELLNHLVTVTGESPAALIRAEIVFFGTRRGGAVFSVGSITFCGSLSHNNYDNNVSRMIENVLRGFGAETLPGQAAR